jgi:hypothetical protein
MGTAVLIRIFRRAHVRREKIDMVSPEPMLSHGDINDSLAVVQGKILLRGEEISRVLKAVTGPKTRIVLVGCDTGKLAQDLSRIIGKNATVYGNVLPWGLGIPWTPIALGVNWGFRNGLDVIPAPMTKPD